MLPCGKRLPEGFLKARKSIRQKCRAILVPGAPESAETGGPQESRSLVTPASPGGPDRGRSGRHVIQSFSGADLGGRPGGRGKASDGGSHPTEIKAIDRRSGPTAAKPVALADSVAVPAWKPLECVISFRICKEDTESMKRLLGENASVNKLARKLLLDFLEGRLRYENARDAEADLGHFAREGSQR